MRVWAEVQGGDSVGTMIEGKLLQVKAGLPEALLGGGKVFEGGCKEHCPVKTGRLRDSIDTQATGENEVSVAPHTSYAIYVELGTYKMAPRNYMRFGYETKREEAIAYIQARLAAIMGV